MSYTVSTFTIVMSAAAGGIWKPTTGIERASGHDVDGGQVGSTEKGTAGGGGQKRKRWFDLASVTDPVFADAYAADLETIRQTSSSPENYEANTDDDDDDDDDADDDDDDDDDPVLAKDPVLTAAYAADMETIRENSSSPENDDNADNGDDDDDHKNDDDKEAGNRRLAYKFKKP
jgi:hypothetical protein